MKAPKHHSCVELHTSKSGSLALIISCRFVLSSGPSSCLYCHLSGTKGHFISFASSSRLLSSSGSRAERVKEQVRLLQQVQPRQPLEKASPSCSQELSAWWGGQGSWPALSSPWLHCPPGKWEPPAIKKAFSRKSCRLVAAWA